jgi:hypothetical protein
VTRERYLDLISCAPQLLSGDLERLRTYQPKLSLMFLSVHMAFIAW